MKEIYITPPTQFNRFFCPEKNIEYENRVYLKDKAETV